MLILEREARLARLAGFTIDEIGRYHRPDGTACPHGRPPHFLSDLNAVFAYILPIVKEPRRRAQALAAWAHTLVEYEGRGNNVSFVSAASLLCDAVEELHASWNAIDEALRGE
jgi:hypothetical protein